MNNVHPQKFKEKSEKLYWCCCYNKVYPTGFEKAWLVIIMKMNHLTMTINSLKGKHIQA